MGVMWDNAEFGVAVCYGIQASIFPTKPHEAFTKKGFSAFRILQRTLATPTLKIETTKP